MLKKILSDPAPLPQQAAALAENLHDFHAEQTNETPWRHLPVADRQRLIEKVKLTLLNKLPELRAKLDGFARSEAALLLMPHEKFENVRLHLSLHYPQLQREFLVRCYDSLEAIRGHRPALFLISLDSFRLGHLDLRALSAYSRATEPYPIWFLSPDYEVLLETDTRHVEKVARYYLPG